MNLLVGTDIESVDRFKKLLKLKEKLLKSIFFESEYNYAINKANSDQSLTGIWCAKEAVVKSFSQVKLITIRDVEIVCAKNCAPKAIVQNLKDEDFNISISISHTKKYATAIAVLIVFK